MSKTSPITSDVRDRLTREVRDHQDALVALRSGNKAQEALLAQDQPPVVHKVARDMLADRQAQIAKLEAMVASKQAILAAPPVHIAPSP